MLSEPPQVLPWQGQVLLVLASSTGGIGAHVASLARGLSAAGVTVTVCGPAATVARLDIGAARFIPVEIPASPRPGDLRAVGALRRAVSAAGRVDVVHAHGLRAGFVAATARLARPLVVTWHNAALSRGPKALLHATFEQVVARSATVTLGASMDLVLRARSAGARDARLGEVAAPTLPPSTRTRAEVRAELGLAPDTPVVLSVGRLHPQKRYDILIAASAQWTQRQPAPVVLIAGSGPAQTDLADRAASLGAPVRLLGHREDVADLLAAADVAVVTSAWEARQLFAQEALRAGVPLVATAVGGVPDLVGEAAVLVPADDVAAVAAAVGALLTDPVARQRYVDAGRAQAATWPTEQQTVAELTALYRELAVKSR